MICFSNLFLQNQKRNFLVLGVAHGGGPWPIFTQAGLKMVIFRGFSKFFSELYTGFQLKLFMLIESANI